ncbi:MAG: metallophosphoesterase [Marinilabiliaceae bacterium]|nr:metallophosphoesterase [Marinilabiliaceae bacterium]
MNSYKSLLVTVIVLSLLSIMASSCDEVIEYSPYQNIIKDKWKAQNPANIKALNQQSETTFKPFKIVLIADSHTYYDDFEKQVKYINTLKDIDFVIHLGDLTLSAINREFEWYSDIINKIKIPVITLIGNHDCLANGYDIYKEMFGPSDFYFSYNGVKFVMFDNIVWEKKVKDPDFEWFSETIVNDKNYTHVIPFAHIPPWDEQFSYGNELFYNYLLEKNDISLSVHGHIHRYDVRQPYGTVNYLSVPSCNRNQLVIMAIQSDTVTFENIAY